MPSSLDKGARSVLVFSSFNIDLTLTVPRFPVPGETIHATTTSSSIGGKGANVSVAAAQAALCPVIFLCCVGVDGMERLHTLKTLYGVNTDYVSCRSDVSTGTAFIMLAAGENTIVVNGGANFMAGASMLSRVSDRLNASVLVVQLEIPVQVVANAVVEAYSAGAQVVFNPSPWPPIVPDCLRESAEIWGCVDVLVMNGIELGQITNTEHLHSERDSATELIDMYSEAINRLQERCRMTSKIVVTLGGSGVLYWVLNEIKHVGAVVVENVVDTTGAGDTFTGYLAAGIAAGKPLEECIRIGVAAGALAVQKVGAVQAIPGAQEVTEMMENM